MFHCVLTPHDVITIQTKIQCCLFWSIECKNIFFINWLKWARKWNVCLVIFKGPFSVRKVETVLYKMCCAALSYYLNRKDWVWTKYVVKHVIKNLLWFAITYDFYPTRCTSPRLRDRNTQFVGQKSSTIANHDKFYLYLKVRWIGKQLFDCNYNLEIFIKHKHNS